MSKGGKVSTAGLEEATREAQAILQQNYQQTREDFEPWRNVGVSGVNKLADLLGLSGGSVQSRDQIYNELLPQYTQQVGGQVSPNQFTDPKTGQVVTVADPEKFFSDLVAKADPYGYDDSIAIAMRSKQDPVERLKYIGYTPYGGQPSHQSVNYDALNAAVNDRLSAQGQTPEGYGSLLESFDVNKFQQDPSYAFRQSEANKALERSLAAQGITAGGAGYGEINPQVARALQEQNQNLASQEYQNAYSRYTNDQLNKYNMLAGVSGMGQVATGTVAQAGQAMAGGTAGLTTDLAGAQLNAQIANNSRPSMFGTLLGVAGQIGGAYAGSAAGSKQLASLFSDSRLKENIVLVDKQNGYNIYEFDYKDGSGRYRGVMADEVKEITPDAVSTHSSGFMMVNYDKLGLKMERV